MQYLFMRTVGNHTLINENCLGKPQAKSTKSHVSLDLKSNCIYCNEICNIDPKQPSPKDWHLISTLQKKKTILDTCSQRIEHDPTDVWALNVKSRVNTCMDLKATKARYHTKCRIDFELGTLQTSHVQGRKPSSKHMDCFKEACRWLEEDNKIHTVKDFREKVQELLGKEQAYRAQYLKLLFKKKYFPQKKDISH